ncbi:MAG TPA: hypothetical protein VF747_05650 [Blastocatellia bacterium]|jgi:uncharacterized protein involved in outer membrane biogenesis
MAKQRRWLPRLLVLLALLVLPLAFAPLLPLDSLKPAVESRLSASLGRKVSIGSLRLSFWGGPYLTINGMTAKEDSAFGDGDFLKAGQVRADFSIFDYVRHRQVVIEGITIKSPEFTLIKNSGGSWSWTTIGQAAPDQTAFIRRPILEAAHPLFAIVTALFQDLKNASFNNIHIEGASVRLIDKTGEQPPESLYKNIKLDASITRPAATSSHATGEFRAESDESDAAEILKTSLPFDLDIDRSANPGLSVKGTLGPGPLQTKNFSAQTFKLDGEISAAAAASPESSPQRRAVSNITGSGHIISGEMFIPSLNISEQVARAVNIAQIGDMSQGTGIGTLETDFRVAQGQVNTSNLRIQQLDGLGDATADTGWFKIESALNLNYVATVLLSPEATTQIKAVNPLIGAAVMVLESNNRVPVPVNITGDVRNPQVQVDVSRIF